MSDLFVDNIKHQSSQGSGTITLGASGETISVPSGATLDLSNATQTGVGGANSPYFQAYQSGSAQTIGATWTKVQINNEVVDSANAYDNSSNYRFTPQTAGKYLVVSNVFLDSDANSNFSQGFIELYKNSSVITEAIMDERSGNDARRRSVHISAIVDMNGSSDFLLVQGYIDMTSSGTPQIGDMSTFSAFKIIE